MGLWMSELQNEFKLPVVYKPEKEIQDLRKLFSSYQMITEQSSQHKNSIQAIFVENGIALDRKQTYKLFKPNGDVTILEQCNIDGAAKFSVLTSLSIMWSLLVQKENIRKSCLSYLTVFIVESSLCKYRFFIQKVSMI